MQIIAGPRQVGKTTVVRQVLDHLAIPSHYASADDPGLQDRTWLEQQWNAARVLVASAPQPGGVLVLDEVQKIGGWSGIVKRLWEEDSHENRELRVVLLGSAPLLMERALSDSLAGRFEVVRMPHWSLAEMTQAFGWDLDMFLSHGGYPGAADLVGDLERWRAYLLDSLVETTISRDILLLTRVDKPALMRRLFRLGCEYSAQVVSYQKLVGQMQDAGNTTTIAHYLDLLGNVGLLTGLEKFSGSAVRRRGSSPKLLALDTGLVTAMAGWSPHDVAHDTALRGRLVETAVGAHLVNTSTPAMSVRWWRDRNREVDYVVSDGQRTLAIEVASGAAKRSLPGMDAFMQEYPNARPLLIGGQGLPLDEALRTDAASLLTQ